MRIMGPSHQNQLAVSRDGSMDRPTIFLMQLFNLEDVASSENDIVVELVEIGSSRERRARDLAEGMKEHSINRPCEQERAEADGRDPHARNVHNQ